MAHTAPSLWIFTTEGALKRTVSMTNSIDAWCRPCQVVEGHWRDPWLTSCVRVNTCRISESNLFPSTTSLSRACIATVIGIRAGQPKFKRRRTIKELGQNLWRFFHCGGLLILFAPIGGGSIPGKRFKILQRVPRFSLCLLRSFRKNDCRWRPCMSMIGFKP